MRKTTTGKRTRTPRARPLPPIWERIAEIGRSIPDHELARWPTDGAANFDHYVDGTPKQAD